MQGIEEQEKRELEVIIAAALYKKRGDRYLKDIENRCSFCLESFRGIIFRSDLNFMPIFVHGQIEEITGYKDNDIASGDINLEEIIHPKERIINSPETMKKLRTVPDFSIEKVIRIEPCLPAGGRGFSLEKLLRKPAILSARRMPGLMQNLGLKGE